MLIAIFKKIQGGLAPALITVFCAFLMKFSMVKILVGLNNSPDDYHKWLQYLYLMFNRPIFTTGTALAISPFLLGNPYLFPMRLFL